MVCWFIFALVACNSGAPTPSLAATPPTPPPIQIENQQSQINNLFTGWAYEAYPEASSEKMRADFAAMRANGANAVWLGHNNPGEVNAQKVEPGMSYAVYAALQNQDDALYSDARAMADAIHRALDAARANDLRVILPIGYQIQMGDAWNQQHPDALRLAFDGSRLNLYHSGYTASPYAPQYRQDIARYYEWVQREFVAPYSDVIVMLSLADEPMGGDYSAHAQNEFARRYGKNWETLSSKEKWKLGEFQSGVIADYAAWSAGEWKRLNPNVLTTMSFHGGDTARRVWGLPDLEKLFSQTPENFIVTFDAYLHDDLAAKPATADERAQLKLFLATIGNYSRAYHKPLALWGGVNAWGLAQESSAPLDIPDAATNLALLYDLPARAGGAVWGIFAWNYNVKQQGLENYARPTTFDVRAMQIAVERAFPMLRTRRTPDAETEIAIVVAPRAMYNALAETHASAMPPNWLDTTRYARAFGDRAALIISSIETLQTARHASYFIAAADAADLDAATLNFVRERLQNGAVIIGNESLARALDAPSETWDAGLSRLPTRGGKIYIVTEN